MIIYDTEHEEKILLTDDHNMMIMEEYEDFHQIMLHEKKINLDMLKEFEKSHLNHYKLFVKNEEKVIEISKKFEKYLYDSILHDKEKENHLKIILELI